MPASIEKFIKASCLSVLVCTGTYYDLYYFAVLGQVTVLVVPPYLYSIEENRHDVVLEDCWTARPQLPSSPAISVQRTE